MQSVSRLYGRRIRGDVGPIGLDPARQSSGLRLPGRIIGPAVSLTGYMQDYEEATDIQHFTLGSRMQLLGGRVFYYARVALIPNWAGGVPVGTILITQYGVKESRWQAVEGLPAPSGATVAAILAAGATQVVVTIGVNDGVASDGVIAADDLVGGHIVIFPLALTPRGINREIIANTVTVARVMTVTLDRPLPIAMPGGGRCAIMASEFANVQSNDETFPTIGVPMVSATSRQFIWVQTWGPSWMSGQLEVGGSDAAYPHNQQVVFRHDGSLGLHGLTGAGAPDPMTFEEQHAGYIMTRLNPYDGFHPANYRGAPFVFLQLRP